MTKKKFFSYTGYFLLFLIISLSIAYFKGGTKVDSKKMDAGFSIEKLNSGLKENKIKVLYFWATWCGACKLNLPFIKFNYFFLKDQIYFLSIEEGESRDELERYIKSNNIHFPVIAGSPELLKNFEISAFPTTLFLNNKNEIVFSDSGILNPISFYLRVIFSR